MPKPAPYIADFSDGCQMLLGLSSRNEAHLNSTPGPKVLHCRHGVEFLVSDGASITLESTGIRPLVRDGVPFPEVTRRSI
jgi:hypothetical protein